MTKRTDLLRFEQRSGLLKISGRNYDGFSPPIAVGEHSKAFGCEILNDRMMVPDA